MFKFKTKDQNDLPPTSFGGVIKWLFFVALFCVYLAGLYFLYRYVDAAELAIRTKWLIGIAVVVVTAVVFFPKEDMLSSYALFAGITILVNSLYCLLLFQNGTAFLSACVTSVFILLTAVYWICIEGDEPRKVNWILSVAFLLECFLAQVLLAATFSFPTAMQWIVGIVFAALFILCAMLDEMIDQYRICAVKCLIFLLANALLLILFKGKYVITFRWVAATCAVISALHISRCFENSKKKYGIFAICDTVLGVGGFIGSFFFTFS